MRKYLMIVVVFISSFIFVKNVNGEELNDYILKKYDKVPDTYIAEIGNDKRRYDYFYVIARNSDKKHLYCIEPGKSINSNILYNGSYEYNFNNLTQDELNKIKLYSYYGYGYQNHSGLNWYAATQYLIWKVKDFGLDIYYTDRLQGNRIDKFVDEMNEIKNLVNNSLIKPSFNNNYNIKFGEVVTLHDNNNILKYYDVVGDDVINASKNNNDLIISGKKSGSGKIKLIRKFNYYTNYPVIYSANDSQTLISSGNLDDIVIEIKVNVSGGKLIINKRDKETNRMTPQGDAGLGNAVYDILDENNNYVTSLTTDKDGYAETNNVLSINKIYLLKERIPSKGYLLDNTVYRFTINKDSLETRIHSYEQVIKSRVDLYKVYNDLVTGIMKSEPGIAFHVYNKRTGVMLKRIVTDSNGYASINLPYGTWTFKQMNSSGSYEKVNDFDIVVDGSEDVITKIISNVLISTKIKVVKIDKDSGKIIKKDGIKFKIKNLDTGLYVCQNITYPNKEKVCVFETKDGQFITPNSLPLGNYQIEEIDQYIEGYLYNNNPYKFSINKDSNFVKDNEYGNIYEIKFYNKQVKGKINITKYGESVDINNGIKYNKILLDNVGYSLYADSDIYSSDGTLIYNKNELIKKIVIKNGKYSLDNLYLGKYYLVEDYTDINHVKNNKKHYFELKYKDQYTSEVIENIELYNYIKKGSLEINKLDYNNKIKLYNTKVEFHIEDGKSDKLIDIYSTDINGKILIDNIPILYGYKYYIKEIEPSMNYILSDEKIYFEFDNNKAILNMYNKKKKGKVDIVVIDKDTLLPIDNTLIKIVDEYDNIIYRGYTDKDGRVYVDSIDYGEYRIIEEEAKDDFIKDDNIYTFNISDNCMYFRLKIYNYKIKKDIVVDDNFNKVDLEEYNTVLVPNTSKNIFYRLLNINYLIIIVILFSLYREVKYDIIEKK